jgi:MYXO-CTERM domain-containing protein
MRQAALYLAAGFSCLAALVHASEAQAYCRTTTCDPATDCDYDARGCTDVGLPLLWKGGCVSYSVQRDASPARNIDYDTIHKIVEKSFDRWTSTDCDGDAPSLTTSDLSPVNCSEPEYNSNNPNANVIMFRDTDWPYDGANATLALTTITFNFETGEIFDADIEVNSFKTRLSTSNTVVEFDLESVITHEAGHFLGLSHSHVEGATMFVEYQKGDLSFRDLSSDDEGGMCAAYPPNRAVPAGDCRPRHGFSPDCRPPPDNGCALRTTPEGSAPAWPLVVMLVIGLPLGLRRRHTRPPA